MARDVAISGNHPGVVIGIDLGTTNSLLAVAGHPETGRYLPAGDGSESPESSFDGHIPVRLLHLPQRHRDDTEEESILFPSVVFQAEKGAPRFVGVEAREARFQYRRGHRVFYSVKSEMGTGVDPFYPSAVSPDLTTPAKVSAVILRAMREAAERKLGRSLQGVPTVITVPASFGPSQRRDTVLAAGWAGFSAEESSLFDEPNAALLAYMNRRRVQSRWHTEETVLVFDFGGGTCDVSIIDVALAPVSHRVTLRNLAISRYERLGGDDIDWHLAMSVLAPKFYEVSGQAKREWGWGELHNSIWGQLVKTAELLKVRMCEELDVVGQARGWNEQMLSQVRVSVDPQAIKTTRGDIRLEDLSLDWDTFYKVMRPFTDPRCSYQEDKYEYMIGSVFAPIKDALEKANLDPRGVTRVLLVGGSSQNPLIERALQTYFEDATIDRPDNLDWLVAEGAAVQAYCHYVLGHDLLAPIVGDTIGLLTQGGRFAPLISAGSAIPYPPDGGWHTHTEFRVPGDWMTEIDLIICAGTASRPVHKVAMRLPIPIERDTPIHLKVRFDSNKVFHFEAFLPDYPDIRVVSSVFNPTSLKPLTSLQYKHDGLEARLKRAQADRTLDQHSDDMIDLAGVLIEMGRYEPALEWIARAAKAIGHTTRWMKAMGAHCHYGLGEMAAAHALWAELASAGDPVMAFNAAISAPDLDVKERFVRQALQIQPTDGAAWCLLAEAEIARGKTGQEALRTAQRHLEAQLRITPSSRFLLGYLARVYDMLGDERRAEQVHQRLRELSLQGPTGPDTTAAPKLAGELTVRGG